mmetsp:Transcript_54853/g.129753  ORF Transcript_54853/g.129753 Transcript_54853/m.129753 type:complete len:218 (-) Transcript_54853:1195-1848(-)
MLSGFLTWRSIPAARHSFSSLSAAPATGAPMPTTRCAPPSPLSASHARSLTTAAGPLLFGICASMKITSYASPAPSAAARVAFSKASGPSEARSITASLPSVLRRIAMATRWATAWSVATSTRLPGAPGTASGMLLLLLTRIATGETERSTLEESADAGGICGCGDPDSMLIGEPNPVFPFGLRSASSLERRDVILTGRSSSPTFSNTSLVTPSPQS